MKLANNRELYEYLLSLSTTLQSRGGDALSQIVSAASRHAAGMSTEFLGESRIALRQVAQDTGGILSPAEQGDLCDVLEQLDQALDRHGKP